MNFREWIEKEIIRENATGTNCIAGFARITLPLVRRAWAPAWAEEDPFFKKKKKKKPD